MPCHAIFFFTTCHPRSCHICIFSTICFVYKIFDIYVLGSYTFKTCDDLALIGHDFNPQKLHTVDEPQRSRHVYRVLVQSKTSKAKENDINIHGQRICHTRFVPVCIWMIFAIICNVLYSSVFSYSHIVASVQIHIYIHTSVHVL